MKLLFATDLHGKISHLQHLADLARRHAPDLVVLGGDVLPDGDLTSPLETQTHFVLHDFRQYAQALRNLCPATQLVTILGNHDWLCSCRALETLEGQGLLHVLEPDRPVRFGGFTFVGYSYTPPSPYVLKDFEKLDLPGQQYPFGKGVIWNASRNEPEPIDPTAYFQRIATMRDDLAHIVEPQTADWVLVAHSPPQGTHLDLLPQAGHVGSVAVRQFILQRQPVLSLHGHIHESPGLTGHFWQRLGSTVAVNPGQREDSLAAVLIEIAGDTISLTPLHIERVPDEVVVLRRRGMDGAA